MAQFWLVLSEKVILLRLGAVTNDDIEKGYIIQW